MRVLCSVRSIKSVFSQFIRLVCMEWFSLFQHWLKSLQISWFVQIFGLRVIILNHDHAQIVDRINLQINYNNKNAALIVPIWKRLKFLMLWRTQSKSVYEKPSQITSQTWKSMIKIFTILVFNVCVSVCVLWVCLRAIAPCVCVCVCVFKMSWNEFTWYVVYKSIIPLDTISTNFSIISSKYF
jgi:hypothetical protein